MLSGYALPSTADRRVWLADKYWLSVQPGLHSHLQRGERLPRLWMTASCFELRSTQSSD